MPQPQEDDALGLLITNDSPIISFLKSIVEPEIISREVLSITALPNNMSSLLSLSSKLKSQDFVISAGKKISGEEILETAYKLNNLDYKKYVSINKRFIRKDYQKSQSISSSKES